MKMQLIYLLSDIAEKTHIKRYKSKFIEHCGNTESFTRTSSESTGVLLHAADKFKNRENVLILVNTAVQTWGRGGKHHGKRISGIDKLFVI